MLTFQNITKNYNGQTILDQLNLTVKPGEFIYLIGKSGAGKSTLLKLISAEIQPSAGQIMFEERNIKNLKLKELNAYHRQLGLIYQDFRLFENCTVRENLAYPLELRGYAEAEIKTKVKEALAAVKLGRYSQGFPNELSGGEKQRLGIARALITQPKLIIADEPTANLDFQTATTIIDLLQQLNQNGTTIIVATHNPEIIAYAPHRLIELAAGRIIRDQADGHYFATDQGRVDR